MIAMSVKNLQMSEMMNIVKLMGGGHFQNARPNSAIASS
jgi:hypothetical protein